MSDLEHPQAPIIGSLDSLAPTETVQKDSSKIHSEPKEEPELTGSANKIATDSDLTLETPSESTHDAPETADLAPSTQEIVDPAPEPEIASSESESKIIDDVLSKEEPKAEKVAKKDENPKEIDPELGTDVDAKAAQEPQEIKEEKELNPVKEAKIQSGPATTVTALSESTERPVDHAYLVSLIEGLPSQPEKLVAELLQNVSAKSSKHKFIALATEFEVARDSKIESQATFGAVWESAKDGYVSIQRLVEGKVLQVTLYWVYIN